MQYAALRPDSFALPRSDDQSALASPHFAPDICNSPTILFLWLSQVVANIMIFATAHSFGLRLWQANPKFWELHNVDRLLRPWYPIDAILGPSAHLPET